VILRNVFSKGKEFIKKHMKKKKKSTLQSVQNVEKGVNESAARQPNEKKGVRRKPTKKKSISEKDRKRGKARKGKVRG